MTPFTWTALCASVLLASPSCAHLVACGLLALDRLLGMHFFTNELGGNMMNYPTLFRGGVDLGSSGGLAS